MKRQLRHWLSAGLGGLCLLSAPSWPQRPALASAAELRLRIVSSQPGKHHAVPAVVWLEPLAGTPALAFPPPGHYTLAQKNRTFIPHLQVIPVGSVVQFPNEDPFFHNVFSFFDGKRFDLGLYEAGSSKAVTFSREGVSYIFCNIHPEMSAVVISVPTSLYALADASDSIALRDIPPGDYKMQIWVESVPQPFLERLTRTIHLRAGTTNLGDLKVSIPDVRTPHTDKFGHAYDWGPKQPY
jgi:plastocyanin